MDIPVPSSIRGHALTGRENPDNKKLCPSIAQKPVGLAGHGLGRFIETCFRDTRPSLVVGPRLQAQARCFRVGEDGLPMSMSTLVVICPSLYFPLFRIPLTGASEDLRWI
jgi:hypothetical protein